MRATSAILLLFLLASCGKAPAPPPAHTPAVVEPAAVEPERAPERDAQNLLTNGDFETGREAWRDLSDISQVAWHGFEVDEAASRHGRRSARMPLAASGVESTAIFGAVQDIASSPGAPFPATLSGYVRIDAWERRTQVQYAQFVVIVWGSDVRPEVPNLQIRYPLGGIDAPPFPIANGRFLFLGPKEPRTGAWTWFERDLAEDWRRAWGKAPSRFDRIRVLFEARFDGRRGSGPEAMCEARFDDLYLGPKLPR